MTKLFKIKAVEVHTNASGYYNINPDADFGYNIMPTLGIVTTDGIFARSEEIDPDLKTVNEEFINMIGINMRFDDIALSEDTRLRGLNFFKATDSANQNPIVNSTVKVLVVLWLNA